IRISIDIVDGRCWLFIDPDIWIWPSRARRLAADFMDARRGERYNASYNSLLDAWLRVLIGESERGADIAVSAYEGGTATETPSFTIGMRTAYTRKLTS